MRLTPQLIAALIIAAPLAAALPAGAQTHQHHAAQAADPALAAAIAGAQRTPADRARDAWRHPLETLQFWGVKPGAAILEISPSGGWWTEILAPYAAKTGGRYIGTGPVIEGPGATDQSRAARRRFEQRFADAATYGKVEVVPFGAQTRGFGPANSVDVVFTARNVHNWMGTPGRIDAVFSDFFSVLKPGGVLGVEEHRSDPRPMKDGASDGYVSEAYVIAAATRAGFVLDGKSEINANPKDTKDHPYGVWTLPPTNSTGPADKPKDPAFDPAKYKAIGESDRMTLRFRKPT
ncbi:class I SAM-dependent methyltransferase [Phenylobacterium immobile]|uniref:class I SAM-dependent methyltransferase n=1 Tax=Phenylobacterium immobile TaxID=21 RepID=UPI000A641D72|nr:methyltransferase [Phenylobacterium immobile]